MPRERRRRFQEDQGAAAALPLPSLVGRGPRVRRQLGQGHRSAAGSGGTEAPSRCAVDGAEKRSGLREGCVAMTMCVCSIFFHQL